MDRDGMSAWLLFKVCPVGNVGKKKWCAPRDQINHLDYEVLYP